MTERERPPGDSAQRPPRRPWSQAMWMALALALLLGLELFNRGQERRRVAYSTFVQLLDSNLHGSFDSFHHAQRLSFQLW